MDNKRTNLQRKTICVFFFKQIDKKENLWGQTNWSL